MKKLKLKKWVKYVILFILDLIIILNLPILIKIPTTVNDYRFNILILFFIIMINLLSIYKIED